MVGIPIFAGFIPKLYFAAAAFHMGWRTWAVLLALALACWCVPQIRGRKPAVSLLGLAFVLILAGEMIGRGVFYGLHMTVGMAVAS